MTRANAPFIPSGPAPTEADNVPNVATPSAIAACCDVVRIPLPTPAISGGTFGEDDPEHRPHREALTETAQQHPRRGIEHAEVRPLQQHGESEVFERM
ncbi:hypothetical protein [Amycolatopsis sp. cmx-11-51]|uniref:hypothetical protein n=1 Tax=unclassified Amycolatopsis TaxID=2618356 RepID=UPI0039E71FE4